MALKKVFPKQRMQRLDLELDLQKKQATESQNETDQNIFFKESIR